VIPGLRDNLKIWKLLQQRTREPCSLAGSYYRVEVPKHRRIAKSTSENLYLRALAQSVNSSRAFIRAVDIVEYCNPHALLLPRFSNQQHTAQTILIRLETPDRP
jgi:hypothetical protein